MKPLVYLDPLEILKQTKKTNVFLVQNLHMYLYWETIKKWWFFIDRFFCYAFYLSASYFCVSELKCSHNMICQLQTPKYNKSSLSYDKNDSFYIISTIYPWPSPKKLSDLSSPTSEIQKVMMFTSRFYLHGLSDILSDPHSPYLNISTIHFRVCPSTTVLQKKYKKLLN